MSPEDKTTEPHQLTAECRAFLRQLGSASGAEDHLERCSWCRERQAAARTIAEALAGLPPVEIPAELRAPAFLAGIYEHAGEAAARRIRPALRAGLTPLSAPADAVWVDEQVSPELAAQLREGLPGDPAPGWLWPRIRDDVRSWRGARRRAAASARRRPTLRIGLMAALVLIAAVLVWRDFSPRNEGTYLIDEPVFKLVREPLDPFVSGGGWTRLGR